MLAPMYTNFQNAQCETQCAFEASQACPIVFRVSNE